MDKQTLSGDAIALLRQLISTPSVSGDEGATADIIEKELVRSGISNINRKHNNIWVYNFNFNPSLPTILLNSHHDTVRPVQSYTRDPFSADIEQDKLYGLGSNDAGASVVSLISAFRFLYNRTDMDYNLCLAITAEEETGGIKGIESILGELVNIEFAIVGEPTSMQMAIGERGLIVLDCVSRGKAGHAARDEGENAIYNAMQDIEWFRTFRFPEKSDLFGDVKMSVTIINAGSQHNMIPSECRFTVDVRVTDRYTNEEVVDIIRRNVGCDVTPRSLRLESSYITPDHPIVMAGKALGLETYGSPTTSDQSLLTMPSLKMGPGDSSRSHTANEFVYLDQIKDGIEKYIDILNSIL